VTGRCSRCNLAFVPAPGSSASDANNGPEYTSGGVGVTGNTRPPPNGFSPLINKIGTRSFCVGRGPQAALVATLLELHSGAKPGCSGHPPSAWRLIVPAGPPGKARQQGRGFLQGISVRSDNHMALHRGVRASNASAVDGSVASEAGNFRPQVFSILGDWPRYNGNG